MYYVYVLSSAMSGGFYKGSTPDLEKRFAKHCDGKVR